MTPTALSRVLVGLVALLAAVGGVDAAIGRVWDLAVLCGAILLLTLVLAGVSTLPRTFVPVRRDLVRWVERYAADGGERPAEVVDRALAAYRAGLTSAWEAADGPRGGRG
ncbi:MAG: hypothetical protein ACKVWR_00480 [Acidimicrobiales bacterium]